MTRGDLTTVLLVNYPELLPFTSITAMSLQFSASAAVTVLPIVQVYTHSRIIPCVIQEHTKDSKITLSFSFLRGKQSKL